MKDEPTRRALRNAAVYLRSVAQAAEQSVPRRRLVLREKQTLFRPTTRYQPRMNPRRASDAEFNKKTKLLRNRVFALVAGGFLDDDPKV